MDELDGHGRHVWSGDWVSNDYHYDILVAEGLGTPASHGLLGEKATEQLGTLVRRSVPLFAAAGGRRLDGVLAKELLDGTILRLPPLAIYKLGRLCARVA
jgi:hypothetical protein